MNINRIFSMFIAGSVVLSAYPVYAQNEVDALRFSYTAPTGTARSMGFGNALGSVGGDFSSLSVNPAGIGIYRSSEIMFTPSLKFHNVEGTYLNQSNDSRNTKLNMNNAGIVFTHAERGQRYDKSSWKTVSFGLGFNRIADFNRNYYYSGLMKGDGNAYNSFSEIFVNDANLYNSEETAGTLGYLGYQSYLIDYDNTSGSFFSHANAQTGLKQIRSVEERGGINEMVLSFGANYQEKLMLGATLGLPVIRYQRDAYFQEDDASGDVNNYFNSFRYTDRLNTSGFGVNLKLGAIYKPSDQFRAGIAFHTPTIYGFSDIFNESLTANTEDYAGIVSVSNPENRFNYTMFTPWKGIISASAFMGKYGFVSMDYEYVDYGSSRFRFENSYRETERLRNDAIRNTYQAVSNVRIGIEGRIDQFFVRGGFGYYGNPYKAYSKGERLDFSGGLGYRSNRFFMDLGILHSVSEEPDIPYTLLPPAVTHTAMLNGKRTQMAFTVGWKM